MSEEVNTVDYSSWSTSDLISRVTELENRLKEQTASYTAGAVAPTSTAPTAPAPSFGDNHTSSLPYKRPKALSKPFDPSKYSTRLIALKFAYLGQAYNGYEHHANNSTPLPTIEEELWKALVKTKLIFPPIKTPLESVDGSPKNTDRMPGLHSGGDRNWRREEAEVNWEGCEYSKCGRTDKGVSAFGQVVGIRVRSNRRARSASILAAGAEGEATSHTQLTSAEQKSLIEKSVEQIHSQSMDHEPPFDPIVDELPYIQLLNRVLPPDIRVLAWCPNPPSDFSARFSCKERRYKYFFTNPCFTPVPGPIGLYPTVKQSNSVSGSGRNLQNREGWLDIEAMREGCKKLVGLHDFRNFCKIDASKQITNFQRRVFHADIEEISPLALPSFLQNSSLLPPGASDTNPAWPKIYAFVVHGSAFLWHQVRSLAAILFLIGQGLEPPSLITELLDIEKTPTKPKYEMATDAPLVLWDCIFPAEGEIEDSTDRETGYQDALQWIYVGEKGGVECGSVKAKGKWGRGGIMDDLWEVWRNRKMDELVAGQLLDVVAGQGNRKLGDAVGEDEVGVGGKGYRSPNARVFDGGNVPRLKGNYIPVLKKERMEPIEVINARYAAKKGWDPAAPRATRDDDANE
ncbi:pseudouridine synthase [Glonium stellatum]|uniref:Pseudouridine synthase n=1 Tax=Glonium stellatum TaxID=574774 RepID=A0A8E2JQ78_9PEZI|nr:pseudouridine synthase [Glonium stellatum]